MNTTQPGTPPTTPKPHEPDSPLPPDPTIDASTNPNLPPGDHPLEIAARAGFGPLSPRGSQVWHGHSTPCVSCGQLVLRDQPECPHCGQNLNPEMLDRMREHAGPWYVFEHVRPFPGVSFERLVRQIRRGVLTETSIVRGPATDHQWRYAVETPGLCLYFGRCWHCHHNVTPQESHCPNCLTYLLPRTPQSASTAEPPTDAAAQTAKSVKTMAPTVLPPRDPAPTPLPRREHATPPAASPVATNTQPATSPTPRPTAELLALRAAVESQSVARHPAVDHPNRTIGGISVAWLAGAMITLLLIVIVAVAQHRSQAPAHPPATPTMTTP